MVINSSSTRLDSLSSGFVGIEMVTKWQCIVLKEFKELNVLL